MKKRKEKEAVEARAGEGGFGATWAQMLSDAERGWTSMNEVSGIFACIIWQP